MAIQFPRWKPGFTLKRLMEEGIYSTMIVGREKQLYNRLRGSSSAFISRTEVRARVFLKDGHACVKCGSNQNLQVDHVNSVLLCSMGKYPFEKLNNLENLQTLCKSCNSSKTP